MKRTMVFSALMLAASLAGAQAPAAKGQAVAGKEKAPPAPPKPVVLQPGKPHEKCMVLDSGQKLEYRFETAAKINFNLHYNKGDSLYYPVKLDRTTGESGLYEAKSREKYCLVWENRGDKDVELTYSYRVGK